MMKQLKQPSQIIKIISDHNNHNISDIIFVQEHSLVQLKDNDLNIIYQANQKIVDAIPINYPLNQYQIAILYQTGYIEFYQPKTHQITFQLSLQGQLKMPYKLLHIKNFLYVTDYIQGMIIINLNSYEEQNFIKKDVKVISVNEIDDHILIFYYTPKKLIQYDLKSQQEIQLLENQQIQRFSNISNLIITNNIMVLYSYQTLSFYQLNPFKEINNYSKLINNKIIDVLEYGLNQNQYLIVQENGYIDLITLKTDQKLTNHINLTKLSVKNILFSYLFNNEILIIVSQDGISVFDSNFVLNFQLELCIGMTNLFEFQNNLYAIKQYNDYSKPFVLKNMKKIEQKQIITDFTQKQMIKQILQVHQYLLIITNNQIQLYSLKDVRINTIINYTSQIYQCMILDDQYIILSNDDQKLQLYQILNDKLQLQDQINQAAILMKSHLQQNQFTIFNDNGYIQMYEIDQNKLKFIAQSQQYLDLSSYHIDKQNLTICRFDCQLTQFQFQFTGEGTENLLQSYQLNSIAMMIDYNSNNNEYQVICQDGQCYIFDNALNVKTINNPIGINNIVQEIQNFNNFYLLTILQQRSIKYLVIEDMNDYYISIKETDSLFLSNKNELYLLNTQSLVKISLRDKEIGYLDVNLFPKNEQVLLLKDQILITENTVYRYFQDSFERIKDFGQEKKTILNADIQGENIVLLLNNQQICIMQAHQNGQIDLQIHQIKENYKYQQVKLSKDIIILTYQNQVTIYSLNKFELLEQFKAIYPDKNVCKDEEIIQIHIEIHSEQQLVLNLLIQQAGIAIIHLKLNKNTGSTQMKLNKKIYSPIDVSEHLRMQMLSTSWQLFNTRNECQVFKNVHNFFDSSLQPIQEKPQIMNDYVIDSIGFNGVIYYLGICGALWSINLD